MRWLWVSATTMSSVGLRQKPWGEWNCPRPLPIWPNFATMSMLGLLECRLGRVGGALLSLLYQLELVATP